MRVAASRYHRLDDEARPPNRRLDPRRRYPLPRARLEDLTLTVGDAQEASRIDLTHVAGMEPAAGDRLRRRFGIAIVALHDVAAAHQHLTVIGNAYVDAVDRLTDGTPLVGAQPAHRDDRRRFGKAVALHDGHVQAEEGHRGIDVQRCAAAGQELYFVQTERVTNLAQ